MWAADAANTHASLAGVALVVGLISLGVLVLFEVNLRIRKGVLSPPEPGSQGTNRIAHSFVRANAIATYGRWTVWFRVVVGAVAVISLLVAGIAAIL
jgi:hypothetical protein